MADAFTQYEMLLKEHMPNAALNLILEDDDPAWALIGTFQPEVLAGRRDPTAVDSTTTAGSYPPGYEARFRIKVQAGGRIAGGRFNGNTLSMVGAQAHLAAGQAADALYLDPQETPLPAWITIKMILKRLIGSMTKNHQQAFAELASNPIDEVAGEVIVDSTRHLRNIVTNSFYADGTAAVALLNDATPPTINETAGGAVVTVDQGSWGRFAKGDLIQFCDSSYTLRVGNGASGSTGKCVVVNIDAKDRTIKVQAAPGVGTIQSLADNDLIIIKDTYDFVNSEVLIPEGVESLLIDSGTFPGSTSPFASGGLDVDDNSELKSFIEGTDGANEDPTMEVLTVLLDQISETGFAGPQAMISEAGVWTLYNQIERSNHGLVQIPMGAMFQAAGGTAGPMLGHQADRFQKLVSKRIRPNSILGINPNTWRKFMPMGDRTIHWVYGQGMLAGFGSIYGPVHQGPQLTELAQAPFNAYCEFGCINPRANLRRLGIKAQRDV
jgi:hypothetical protein